MKCVDFTNEELVTNYMYPLLVVAANMTYREQKEKNIKSILHMMNANKYMLTDAQRQIRRVNKITSSYYEEYKLEIFVQHTYFGYGDIDVYFKGIGNRRQLSQDQKDGVWHIVNNILPDEAKPIVKAYIDGKPLAVIAKELGITYRVAERIFYHALYMFRKECYKPYVLEGYIAHQSRMDAAMSGGLRAEVNEWDVAMLNISRRLYYLLKRRGFNEIGDINSLEQMRVVPGLGKKGVDELVSALAEFNIVLPDCL